MKKMAVPAVLLSMILVSAPVSAASAGLDKTDVQLSVGESTGIRLKGSAKKTKWRVTDSSVFSYRNGKITAVGEGTADLIVTSGGRSYKCTVTVTSDNEPSYESYETFYDETPGFISYDVYDNYDLVVQKGQSVMVDVPSDTLEVYVTCDNSKLVGISCGLWNGETFELKIKGKAPGYTDITVRQADGTLVKRLKVKVGGVSSEDDRYQRASENYSSEVVRLVNEERAKYGILPLEEDETLSGYAATRAEELSERFSHTRPDGTKGLDIIKISYTTRAENIAQGQASPKAVVAAWMKSGGHRSNILNPEFTSIGVGYDESTDSWVQLFIG